jgi:hypothetical protein
MDEVAGAGHLGRVPAAQELRCAARFSRGCEREEVAAADGLHAARRRPATMMRCCGTMGSSPPTTSAGANTR